MKQSFESALEFLKRNPYGAAGQDYLAACNTIANNLDQLAYRLYFYVPGGLRGNSDPAWNHVRENSTSLCGCGNERAFEPGAPIRPEFEPSPAGATTLRCGDRAYVRPIGAPAQATYAMIELQPDSRLLLLANPLKGVDLGAIFAQHPCIPVADLADMLASNGNDPLVFKMKQGEEGPDVPVAAITGADPDAITVTVLPDAATEFFNPSAESDRHEH